MFMRKCFVRLNRDFTVMLHDDFEDISFIEKISIMELQKSYSRVITPNLDFDSSAVLLQTFFTGVTFSEKLSLRMRNV